MIRYKNLIFLLLYYLLYIESYMDISFPLSHYMEIKKKMWNNSKKYKVKKNLSGKSDQDYQPTKTITAFRRNIKREREYYEVNVVNIYYIHILILNKWHYNKLHIIRCSSDIIINIIIMPSHNTVMWVMPISFMFCYIKIDLSSFLFLGCIFRSI